MTNLKSDIPIRYEYENTYVSEVHEDSIVQTDNVRKVAESVIESLFNNPDCLDSATVSQKCVEASGKIRDEIKNLNINKQYKYIVDCIAAEEAGQGLQIATKVFWDVYTDMVVRASYSNHKIRVVAIIYFFYFR